MEDRPHRLDNDRLKVEYFLLVKYLKKSSHDQWKKAPSCLGYIGDEILHSYLQ